MYVENVRSRWKTVTLLSWESIKKSFCNTKIEIYFLLKKCEVYRKLRWKKEESRWKCMEEKERDCFGEIVKSEDRVFGWKKQSGIFGCTKLSLPIKLLPFHKVMAHIHSPANSLFFLFYQFILNK